MFRNYLRTAWRNLLHNKMSSLINISGLSIGIAAMLLIAIYIGNELSFDKFHQDANRIYQVTMETSMGGEEGKSGNTPPPVGAALCNNFPEIESFTRFNKPADLVIRSVADGASEKVFTESKVLAVDSNFLEVFSFHMLEGDPVTALQKPGSIVITEEMAKKYFPQDAVRPLGTVHPQVTGQGYRNIVGKILRVNETNKVFTVTAVLQNPPSQSTIQFDFLAPIADFPVVKRFSWSWVWRQMITYVKLKPNAPRDARAIKELESKFPAMISVQAAPAFDRIGKNYAAFIKAGGKWDVHLLPLTSGHLYSDGISMPWLYHVSNIKYVYIFSSIAVFIIILASVNFMNLSTAQSGKRAKEVGIRKVSGSTRGQLIRQFMTEAFLYSLISSSIAFILAWVLVKPFSAIAGENLDPDILLSGRSFFYIIVLTFIIALLAGSYPAFYLTSFNPVSVLKGKLFSGKGKSALFLRNGLVIFQFSISTILIICTLVVFRQLNFFRTADMGLNKENVLVISNANRLGKTEESFRQTIGQLPGISNASITSSLPTGFLFGDSYEPIAQGDEHLPSDIVITSYLVDYDFVSSLQLSILEGRNFSREFSDSGSVILNEEAVKQIGWKDPIGRYMRYPGGHNELYKVIGVIRNFNVESLRSSIVPFALFHVSSNSYDVGTSLILAKLKSGDPGKAIASVEKTWKAFAPGEPFDYNFLDASFDAQYRAEQRMGKIFGIFTGLSIFIACLGLFGLSAYIAERRIKEIGIRKVLGASSKGLVAMLSIDFLKLTLIATLLAFPLSWWAMNRWLQDFPYRIQMGWLIFLIGGLCTFLIAMFTISFQAIRAANANPLENLRME